MSEHIARELHRLYRDYYANRLALSDYRHQRGLLLNSLLPVDADAEAMQTLPREKIDKSQLTPPPPPPKPEAKTSAGMRWPAGKKG